MKLPAIDLQGTLGKVPGLSKFIKSKAGASGAARGKAAQAKSHEQQVQQRLDLTMKGLGGLATVLVLFALYSVFAQSGLNKAIHTAAPPMVDLSELVATHGGKGASGKGDHAKEAKAANNAKLKLPEGTDPRIDYAFEQIANFENTRSEAVLRSTRANVAGVAPGSVAARAGFRVGDFILSIDGDQAGFVWDSLRKLTAAGKSSVLLEVQRGNEVLRGELLAPEGELLTSTNTGLLFEIPEGYRFIGENDRRELRGGFSRLYMEGLAGDERLAYATSLALLGGNLVKRGVEQADLKPSDPMWLKTEQILADHHSKFSKALAHHGAVLETMQANLQAGFVKIGALLLAALIAGIAALASALQLNKHLSEQGIGAMRAQFQGLRSQMDQLAHLVARTNVSATNESTNLRRSSLRQDTPGRAQEPLSPVSGPSVSTSQGPGMGFSAGFSLAELAAKVALDSEVDDSIEKPEVALGEPKVTVEGVTVVEAEADHLSNNGLVASPSVVQDKTEISSDAKLMEQIEVTEDAAPGKQPVVTSTESELPSAQNDDPNPNGQTAGTGEVELASEGSEPMLSKEEPASVEVRTDRPDINANQESARG